MPIVLLPEVFRSFDSTIIYDWPAQLQLRKVLDDETASNLQGIISRLAHLGGSEAGCVACVRKRLEHRYVAEIRRTLAHLDLSIEHRGSIIGGITYHGDDCDGDGGRGRASITVIYSYSDPEYTMRVKCTGEEVGEVWV